MKKTVQFYRNNNTIIAMINSKDAFTGYGISTCGKHDIFDIVKGCKIAFMRALTNPKKFYDVEDLFRCSDTLFVATVKYAVSDIVRFSEWRGMHIMRDFTGKFGFGVVDEITVQYSMIEIILK